MTLKVMSKVKSKVTIGLPGKNPTILVQVIFLCDAYFSNYPAVPELLTHPVYYIVIMQQYFFTRLQHCSNVVKCYCDVAATVKYPSLEIMQYYNCNIAAILHYNISKCCSNVLILQKILLQSFCMDIMYGYNVFLQFFVNYVRLTDNLKF